MVDEMVRSRYYEVRVPLSGSNVRTVVLLTCRDCGVFVFNRLAHDEHHTTATGGEGR